MSTSALSTTTMRKCLCGYRIVRKHVHVLPEHRTLSHVSAANIYGINQRHIKGKSCHHLGLQEHAFHHSVSPALSKSTDIKHQMSRATAPSRVDFQEYGELDTESFPDSNEFGTQTDNQFFKGMSTDFPCLSRNKMTTPEPTYNNIQGGYRTFTYKQKPFGMKYNQAILPNVKIAYETWGALNKERDNAVIIHAGLSASSHAKSHKDNMTPGWWEKFVGAGCAVDTDKLFVICTNNIGSCYGSTGPSSINPVTSQRYATTFPLLSIEDMVEAQFLLLDHLGIDKLHASVGSSLGGMCSLLSAALHPDRVGSVVTISSCAQSHPSSIAMRYLQRKTIMCDPNWNKGHYYDDTFPMMGMKLAREIATTTYRSGQEWEERFGRDRIDNDACPSLCPTFVIENYLEYQGESFSHKYDPNSLLYLSKAMDLFDMADDKSLHRGLSRVKCPTLVMGVKSDLLFPIWQQRRLAKMLKESGNPGVSYYEIDSIYGHDTFLLEVNDIGSAVKGFLETELRSRGHAGTMKTLKYNKE